MDENDDNVDEVMDEINDDRWLSDDGLKWW
jgi:hypothetical protein